MATDSKLDMDMDSLFGDDAPIVEDDDPANVEATGASSAPTLDEIFGDDSSAEEFHGDTDTYIHDSGEHFTPSDTLYLPKTKKVTGDRKNNRMVGVDLLRFPKSMGVTSSAFDPTTFNEEEENEMLKKNDMSGANDTLIRFRFKRGENGEILRDEYGKPLLEANARIVEWSDGSRTMHIGKEVFNIRKTTVKTKHTELRGDSDFLYARVANTREGSYQVPETILEAQTIINDRYVLGSMMDAKYQLKPLPVDTARDQRKKPEVLLTGYDFEGERLRRIKEEEEAARMLARAQRKEEDARLAELLKDKRTQYASSYLTTQSSVFDNMEDEQEGSIDIAALKKGAKKPAAPKKAKKAPAKKLSRKHSDSESDDSYGGSDSGSESSASSRSSYSSASSRSSRSGSDSAADSNGSDSD